MTALDGRSFVITGASGYLGTALAQALAAHACRLRLVSRSPLVPRLRGPAQVETVVADLRGPAAWTAGLAGTDTVFHLSAQTNLRFAEAVDPGNRAIKMRIEADSKARGTNLPKIGRAHV